MKTLDLIYKNALGISFLVSLGAMIQIERTNSEILEKLAQRVEQAEKAFNTHLIEFTRLKTLVERL